MPNVIIVIAIIVIVVVVAIVIQAPCIGSLQHGLKQVLVVDAVVLRKTLQRRQVGSRGGCLRRPSDDADDAFLAATTDVPARCALERFPAAGFPEKLREVRSYAVVLLPRG